MAPALTPEASECCCRACQHIPKLGDILCRGDNIIAASFDSAYSGSCHSIVRIGTVEKPQQDIRIGEVQH
jgi:hypothetical protein